MRAHGVHRGRLMSHRSALALVLWLAPMGAFAGEPGVTMLAPGFTARPLPVRLSNINNLEYAADGRLFALGYDGRIHLLTDEDGDGLEETVKPFWYQGEKELRGPIGMALAPEGVYVASKGRVTLVRDRDR